MKKVKIRQLELLPSEIRKKDIFVDFSITEEHILGKTFLHKHPFVDEFSWNGSKRYFDHDKRKFHIIRIGD